MSTRGWILFAERYCDSSLGAYFRAIIEGKLPHGDTVVLWDRPEGQEVHIHVSQDVINLFNGPVVESADTDALKASDASHGGSSPSGPTTYITSDLQETDNELISKISWSGRYIPLLNRLVKLPGAIEIVNQELAKAAPVDSNFSKQLDLTPKQRWENMMAASELPIKVGQKRMFFVDGLGDMDGTITRFDDEACWLLVDGEDVAWWIPWDAPGMSHVSILMDGIEYKKLMEATDAQSQAGSDPGTDSN